jgi:hypothetical protein
MRVPHRRVCPDHGVRARIADFFIVFFAVIQRDVLYRNAAQQAWDADRAAARAAAGHVVADVDDDFTQSPRTPLNNLKLFYYRYWYRLVIVLTFVGGTSNVSVLSGLYLGLSLLMLSYGEGVLLTASVKRWVLRPRSVGHPFVGILCAYLDGMPCSYGRCTDGTTMCGSW